MMKRMHIRPINFATREMLLPAKRSMASAQRYLDVTLDADYANVLRAYHYETKTIKVPVMDDNPPMIDVPNVLEDGVFGNRNDNLNYQTIVTFKTVTTTVKVYEKHDGIVSERSSQLPTTMGVSVENITLPGVNHMEMNAHSAVRNELNSIFAGGYGDAFDYNK